MWSFLFNQYYASQLRYSQGYVCGAAGPPVGEVGPAIVLDAALDGEQSVCDRFRPTAPRPLEAAPDEWLAGPFRDVGSDRQSALPAAVAAHSVPVGLKVVDAGRDGFVPVAVRLQVVEDAVAFRPGVNRHAKVIPSAFCPPPKKSPRRRISFRCILTPEAYVTSRHPFLRPYPQSPDLTHKASLNKSKTIWPLL